MVNTFDKILNASVAIGLALFLGCIFTTVSASFDLTELVRAYPAEVYGGAAIAAVAFGAWVLK